MNSYLKPGALVLALLVVGAFFAGNATSQARFEPASVAFVDVGRVFKEYKKATEIQQQIREELKRIDEPLRRRIEELKRRRGELDLVLPGTPEYAKKKRELDRDAFLLEYDEKQQKGQVQRGLVKRMSQIYTEIRSEAENIARRAGVKAVFMVNTHELEARTQEELQVLIASRPVIFWDQALDITEDVLKVMNEDESVDGGNGGAPEEGD